MCGIAGFYNTGRQNFTASQQLLERMHERISHRGPDAHGTWISPDRQLGLSSRRLKIIDLSNTANQPFYDHERQIVLCYNGEIYNHAALRKELEALGYAYRTTSDTETILYAYHAWGIECINRFEGMFAFVLFDLRSQELYLVRDRIGVKPLYFSLQNGIVSFASEIKALWELPWIDCKLNKLAWHHYLSFMVSPAPMTIFEGIYKLPAGFYAHIDMHKRISFHEWYSPVTNISKDEQKDYSSEGWCIQRITQLLMEATQKRMVADVPVGAFLSGGLDSSLNVALMSQYHSNIKTFTVGFAGAQEHNEFSWARQVSDQFGTEHHEKIITEAESFLFYEQMVKHLDEPLADCVCIPFYFVSKLAHDVGMKVVQVGEGADELFFGYPAYARYAQVYHRFWLPTQRVMPQRMRQAAAFFLHPLLAQSPLKTEVLYNWAHDRSLFWGGALAFGEKQKNMLLPAKRDMAPVYDEVVELIYPGMQLSFDSHAIISYHLEKLMQRDPEANFYKQMLYVELKQRLPELLLMRADKMSMAASIEAREPFLDHKLIEFMMHVPPALLFKNNTTKYLLKKVAEQFLPHDIIYRKKVGFGAPTATWFAQGAHFAPYAAKLAQGTTRWDDDLGGAYMIDAAENKNQAHRAVQNWVLQQMRAFARLI